MVNISANVLRQLTDAWSSPVIWVLKNCIDGYKILNVNEFNIICV